MIPAMNRAKLLRALPDYGLDAGQLPRQGQYLVAVDRTQLPAQRSLDPRYQPKRRPWTWQGFELAHWQQKAFERGAKLMHYDHPNYRGSRFAYGSTRSAGLLVDRRAGRRVADRQDSEALPPILNCVIRLQAVKCSPKNTTWSDPAGTMWEECPPMLLIDELSIAQPGCVLGFGANVRWVLERLPGFTAGPTARAALDWIDLDR